MGKRLSLGIRVGMILFVALLLTDRFVSEVNDYVFIGTGVTVAALIILGMIKDRRDHQA